jgi:arylsulfatase A-like enzyme
VKTIMVMFDSLNRHMLPSYGCDWTHAPNFRRLAERSVQFNRSYVCSMPCMPARRDFHTGRPNFTHRGWGPLEPFDDSVPQMLSEAGVSSHLISDHYHYWEDGGCTYHGRYDTWQFFRGQEGDPWMGQVADPMKPANLNGKGRRQDWVNRQFMRRDEQLPQARTFEAGLDFINRNHDQDRWFLQVECFDPHEPFVSGRTWRDLYPRGYDGPLFDWPNYGPVTEPPEAVEELRYNYAALLSRCDRSLGDVLDAMDAHNMWDDTMLIVWTDHGFLLGEHDCWAKNWMPLYDEVSRTPLFIWDPRNGRREESREALVQPAIDLGPTLLEFFGLEPTGDMTGKVLRDTIADDAPVREAAIFGYFGQRVNVTDGRYVYMRGVSDFDAPRHHHTLMPTNMRNRFGPEMLRGATLSEPLAFTKGMPVLRVPAPGRYDGEASPAMNASVGNLLFDVEQDPHQQRPLDDPAAEQRMIDLMLKLLHEAAAPAELYQRLGLAGQQIRKQAGTQ